MVLRGDRVKVKIFIKNTGTSGHRFVYYAKGVSADGSWTTLSQWETEYTGMNKTDSRTLHLPTSITMPGGSYKVIASIWEKLKGGQGWRNLSEVEIPNAFTID